MIIELLIIFFALIILVVNQLIIARSFHLFRRRFWLDEIVTHALVSDPDLVHSLRAIAGGLDTNPPVYHLILRAVRFLIGNTGEISLRCFSLLSVLIALVGLYLNLRQVYAPLVAFTAILAVWGHPVVLRYAFEARMYGPWLASLVWFSYALGRSWNQATDSWPWVLLACTSVLTCTMHTLGTLSLAIVMLSHFFSHYSSLSLRYPLVLASLGPLAFLAWTPLSWRQNNAYPTTWMEKPDKWTVFNYLNSILFPRHLAAVLVGAGLAPFLPGIEGRVESPVVVSPDLAVLAGLAGLVFMPLILIVLSFSVITLMGERFALPAVSSIAVASASVVSHVQAPWLLAVCGLLYILGGWNLKALRDSYRQQEERMDELIQTIKAHTAEEPILFEETYYLHAIYYHFPEMAGRCFAIDYQESEIGHSDANLLASRNFNRIFCRFYSIPRMGSWIELSNAATAKLYLVLPRYIQQGFFDLEKRYPGFSALPIEAGLYQLVATQHPAEAT